MLPLFALRFLRRYKLFFLLGLVIISAQIFLAYKLLKIPIFGQYDGEKPGKLYEKIIVNNLSVDEDIPISHLYEKGKDMHKKLEKSLLNLSGLEFTPPCYDVNKETLSAVQRAKSQDCKLQILQIACDIQKETFYPKTLPNTCPNGERAPNRSLGCFKDEKNFRILSGYYTNFKTQNSPKKCLQMCLQSGFLYAGVQYATECFCGNDEPKQSAKLPDSSCNMKCAGEPKKACGGYYTINIYETGIAKFAPQKAQITAKEGAAPIKIAFLLTLNGRALRQVHRLLKALYSSNHFYYIHIDSRQDYLFRELQKLESNFSNIRLARNRYSTIWGGASLLQMLLASMEDLLNSGWNWDFVLNLSESDFPVKTIDKLVEFLTANRGKNFVKSHGREVQRFIQKQGLDKTFVECDTHMWRIGDRSLPTGIQIDGGSDWVCLSRNFVEYVTSSKDDTLVNGLLKIFGQTLLPAESFFHTVLRNSEYCRTYIDNNLHVTNWKRKLGCKCQYKHVVDWCGCSPNDFKPDDWSRLQMTELKHLYFARKFEPIINQAVILQLEEWLFGPYPADYFNLNAYWQSVYHYEDNSPAEDGAIINVVNGLMRVNSKSNAVQFYEPLRILEITNYLEYDTYRGFLVHHEAMVDGHLAELETWCVPNFTAQVTKKGDFANKIISFDISTNFDPKELVARNLLKIISTNSEPVLIFRWAGTKIEKNTTNFSFTVVWLSPMGEMADFSDILVDEQIDSQVHSVKASMKRPLLAGVWTVKLIHKKTLVALSKFLVTESKIIEIKSQSKDQLNVLPLAKEIRDTDGETGSARNVNKSRQPKIISFNELDKQVFTFFTIRETCFVRNLGQGGDNKFTHCSKTNWSSMAPDPKSDVSTMLIP